MINTVRLNMEESTIDQVAEALRELSIDQSACRRIVGNEALVLFKRLLDRFTGGVDCRWWWEKFSDLSASFHCRDNLGFNRISDIVPDPEELVYFVLEENYQDHYPIFVTTPRIAQQIIGECYGFEYYLISKDFSWLLCENHHSVLIGLGEAMKASFISNFGEDSSFFN